MIVTRRHLPRRTFLKGMGTVIALPMNQTYWTNWPDANNPYINSANWHRTFELVLLSLKPVAA